MKQDLKIADIRIDGGTQARTSLNETTVAEYTDALLAGDEFPAAVVFFDGSAHYLADGFHRLHAHRAAGMDDIACVVHNGTRRDAVLYAVGANGTHGLRRTREDKRRAVRMLLEDAEWGQWSDREVAKRCDVSHPTVAAARAELQPKPHLENLPDASPEVRKFARGGEVHEQRVKQPAETAVATPRTQPDTAPSAGTVTAPDDDGPSAAEIAEARRSAEDDAEAVRLLLESDDKLAEMTDKCKQQAALIRTLEERIRGLTNEAAQAIRLAKSWRAKCEKLEKAAA